MSINIIPDWMANLEDEDLTFIRKFIISSGSLKQLAQDYNVTYPTVRLRLDRLIQKIKISEDNANNHFIALIKRLAIDEKFDVHTAKVLITEYQKINKRGGDNDNS